MRMSKIILLLFVAITAIPAYCSDFTFGSTARSMSLGGAGLALGDNFHSTAVTNPAAPAVYGAKFKFIMPGLDFKASGASAGKIWENVENMSGGDSADAISLANDFASKDTLISFSSVGGFAGTSGVLVGAQVSGSLTPSEDVKRWARASLKFDPGTAFNPMALVTQLNNANLTSAVNYWQSYNTSGQAADKTAAESAFNSYLTDLSTTKIGTSFVWGPTFQFSGKMPATSGDLWIGTNVSILNSESREWTVVANDPGFTYSGNNISLTSVNFTAVSTPTKSETSLKADIGMIYKPADSVWQYGMVFNNFIKPRLSGIRNAEGDAMISIGVAAKPVSGFVFAADLINLTNSNGEDVRLRTGAEFQASKSFALRIGHSGDKLTYGANLFGFDIAFSEDSPSLISNVIRF